MTHKLKDYQPLIIVVVLSLAMSFAIYTNFSPGLMNLFMGFFLCLLAMFKLFDISGFADGFQMYDIIAKQMRIYAYIYPFIEVGLGLAFLAGLWPLFTNIMTLIVMTISAIGVIKSIATGMDLRCACLGTILKVPLSTVSIVENVGMGLMAIFNIIFI